MNMSQNELLVWLPKEYDKNYFTNGYQMYCDPVFEISYEVRSKYGHYWQCIKRTGVHEDIFDGAGTLTEAQNMCRLHWNEYARQMKAYATSLQII